MTRRARRAHGPSASGRRRDAADREAIEAVPTRVRIAGSSVSAASTASADHDRAGDPDRAQDHELEEDQAEQAEQHRQPAEEHRAAGRGDRDPDGVGDARPGPPAGAASSSRNRLVISSE